MGLILRSDYCQHSFSQSYLCRFFSFLFFFFSSLHSAHVPCRSFPIIGKKRNNQSETVFGIFLYEHKCGLYLMQYRICGIGEGHYMGMIIFSPFFLCVSLKPKSFCDVIWALFSFLLRPSHLSSLLSSSHNRFCFWFLFVCQEGIEELSLGQKLEKLEL